MARLSGSDLEFCRAENICVDCYKDGRDTQAKKLQKRKRTQVPCCREHFYSYRAKLNQADANDYALNSSKKKAVGRCSFKGCKNKLIPRELLPPWISEKTCGVHARFKAFRANRSAMLRLITEHCLTQEERARFTAHNLIYRSGDSFVFFGAARGKSYKTIAFSSASLLELYKRTQKPMSKR